MKKFRPLIYLLLVILIVCLLIVPSSQAATTETATPSPVHGLLGQYFNSFQLTGPSAVRIDPQLDFIWDDSPAFGVTNDFIASWTGTLVPDVTDLYTLSITGDDRIRVYINEYLVIDDWEDPCQCTQYTSSMYLVSGEPYAIRIELQDLGGPAKISLHWRTVNDSIPDQVIPAENLFPPVGALPPTLVPGLRHPHELCVHNLSLPESEDTPDDEPTGTSEARAILFDGSVADLQRASLTVDDIIGGMHTDALQVLIVPIGFPQEEIDQKFPERVATLDSIWSQLGLNIHYTYVRRSLPILVYGTKEDWNMDVDNSSIEQVQKMVEALGEKPDVYIFNVNTSYGGAHSRWDAPVIEADDSDYLYTMLHELAHQEGLEDGYESTGGYYNIGRILYSTEFFLADENGLPIIEDESWKAWVEEHHVTFVATDMMCLGQPLLKMEGAHESVMETSWSDEEVLSPDGKVNMAVFTPFQMWLMGNHTGE